MVGKFCQCHNIITILCYLYLTKKIFKITLSVKEQNLGNKQKVSNVVK